MLIVNTEVKNGRLKIKLIIDWSFFAVLDGHGGDEVAKRAANLMVPAFLSQPAVSKLTNRNELHFYYPFSD